MVGDPLMDGDVGLNLNLIAQDITVIEARRTPNDRAMESNTELE